jgi:hypothetical protein
VGFVYLMGVRFKDFCRIRKNGSFVANRLSTLDGNL